MWVFTPQKSADTTHQGLIDCVIDCPGVIQTVMGKMLIMKVHLRIVSCLKPLHHESHEKKKIEDLFFQYLKTII